jgi:hypothetical protein
MTPLFFELNASMFSHTYFLQNSIDAVLFRKQPRACNKREQA